MASESGLDGRGRFVLLRDLLADLVTAPAGLDFGCGLDFDRGLLLLLLLEALARAVTAPVLLDL